MTDALQKSVHTNLMASNLRFGRDLVLIVRGVQTCQGCLVGLTDVLELLNMATSRSEIHLSNFEGGPADIK
jgi:hypothetical protein